MKIRIGTRKSALALAQTDIVINELKKHFPNDSFEAVKMSTKGDRELDKSLQSFGGKGVFIEEIENALLEGEIDMAVHSAKDMPVELPEGLCISAALYRADRRDVLVYFGDTIDKEGHITIGTSSARRDIQARRYFPNAAFRPIRGNIHTRLEKVRRGEYDAVIMAKAALDRLGIEDADVFEFGDDFLCAAGQGILAIESVRGHITKYTDAINDTAVMAELKAERSFLRHIGGGCHSPCGASAVYKDGCIALKAFYAPEGHEIRVSVKSTDASQAGRIAVEEMRKWFIL